MPTILEKKIAGIPTYVWGILIIGAIGVGLYLRKRTASAAALSDTTPTDYGTGNLDAVPIPGTVGGGAGGGGITSEPTPPPDYTPILTGIQSLGDSILGAIASIPVPSTEPSPPLPSPAPAPSSPPIIGVTAPTPPPSPVSPPAPPSTVTTPPPSSAPGPVPGATFTWVFASIAGLPAKSVWSIGDKSLFMAHLKARSLSYASWRANHPSAACRVFGDC